MELEEKLIEDCVALKHEGKESADLRAFLKLHDLSEEKTREIMLEADHIFLNEIRVLPPKAKRPKYFWMFLVLIVLLAFLLMVLAEYAGAGLLVLVLIYLSLRKFRASPTSYRNEKFNRYKR